MTGLIPEKEFSRKSFVKGGGALVVGFSFLGAGLGAKSASAAATPQDPFASNGPFEPNSPPAARPGLTSGSTAAPALPATAAPATENPTTSAPPPLTNDLRENSFSCMNPVITHLPLP